MNVRQVWSAALSELQQQTTRSTYDTWLKGTTILSYEDGTCLVGVPSAFAKEWLESRFAERIAKVLAHHIGQPVQVRFQVQVRAKTKSAAASLPLPLDEDEAPAAEAGAQNGHAADS